MILENPDKLTNQDLVKIILDNGFSTNKPSTLLRYPKEDLLRTIEEENDQWRNAQDAKDKEATANFIDSCLAALDSIKMERDGKPNNPSAKKICKANLSDEAFMSEKNHKIFKLIFAFASLGYILFETFNLKKFFRKKTNLNVNPPKVQPA